MKLNQNRDKRIFYLTEKSRILDNFPFQVACEKFKWFAPFIDSVITGREMRKAKSIQCLDSSLNLKGRNIECDVVIEYEDGSITNIEATSYAEGEGIKRGLFHSYVMGSRVLRHSEKWDRLKSVRIILLNESDSLKKGLPLYLIKPVLYDSKGNILDEHVDAAATIYVANLSAPYDGSLLLKLFHDLKAVYNEEEMMMKEMEEVSSYLRSPRGDKAMTSRVKEFANQIIEETEKRVRKETEERVKKETEERIRLSEIETKYKNAAKFIKRGYDPNEVATTLNLTSSDMAIIQSQYVC